MKKVCYIAMAMLLGATVNAQSSLDLVSRAQLRQHRLVVEQQAQGKEMMKIKGMPQANASRMLGMIKLADGCSAEQLEAEGVEVLRCSHGFAFVTVAVDDVERVAGLSSVKRFQLARPMKVDNDLSRASDNVDKIHSGDGLKQAYTGKGVICGIVDTGFDPNHVNFLDEEGNPRVGFLSQINADMYTGSITEKFYGNYTADNVKDITTFKTDDATTYHGSHTLGTMAGGYRGAAKVAVGDPSTPVTVKEMPNPYYGMAYNSDLALGCGDLYDAIIAYNVDYILGYADYENKPTVINLSLGSNSGAHDGKGMINQYFDAVAKADKAIICCSAGNEGDLKIALNKTFTADDKQVKTFILGQDMSEYGYNFLQYGNLQIYSNDNNPFTMQVVIFNKQRNKVVQRYPLAIDLNNPGTGQYWVSSAEYQESASDIIDTTFANYFTGYIGMGWTYDEDTGRFNALLDYFADNNQTRNSSGNYVIGLEITGEEGQRVDLFCDGMFSSLTNFDIEGYDDGMTDGTISDMASGNSLLVVGSYNTRQDWAALDGGLYSTGYDITVGNISAFSSYGTLVDGRELPHVCAPGAVVNSTMNSYYVSAGYANPALLVASAEANGKTYYWGWSVGTSMASPHVAGSIATWLEADPTLTIDDVKDIVAKTAVKDEAVLSITTVQAGAGKFNAYEGLKEVLRRADAGVGNISVDDERTLVSSLGDKRFNVFLADAASLDIAVYDLTGKLHHTAFAQGNETDIDLSALSKGIYVLSVNGNVSQKIVIR